VAEPLVIRDVAVWDGRGGSVMPGRCVILRDGVVSEIADRASPSSRQAHTEPATVAGFNPDRLSVASIAVPTSEPPELRYRG